MIIKNSFHAFITDAEIQAILDQVKMINEVEISFIDIEYQRMFDTYLFVIILVIDGNYKRLRYYTKNSIYRLTIENVFGPEKSETVKALLELAVLSNTVLLDKYIRK